MQWVVPYREHGDMPCIRKPNMPRVSVLCTYYFMLFAWSDGTWYLLGNFQIGMNQINTMNALYV